MPKHKDLTGEKINNWIVKEFKGFNKHKQSLWLVECDCIYQTQRIKTTSQIKANKSCGCLDVENLNGMHFGKWEVISNPIIKTNNRVYFKCRCSCENHTIKIVRADRLKDGTSSSCGCYAKEIRTKHGLSKERITNIWYGMLDRCTNPERKDFKNYGGRGIKVCDEWSEIHDYQGLKNFTCWSLENGYNDNLSIERIDVDGNYEPNNCTWVTMKKQAQNKRNTIYLDIDSSTDKLIDIAEQSDINRETILRRYQKGIREIDILLSKKPLNNKSGVIGVSYSSIQNNWRAYINIDKQRIELGCRKDKIEAIKLRLDAEIKYYGIDNAPQKHLFTIYNINIDRKEIVNERLNQQNYS